MIGCVYPALGQDYYYSIMGYSRLVVRRLVALLAGDRWASVWVPLHVHPPTQTPLQASCFARTFILREKP
jgi:hypothetical protein